MRRIFRYLLHIITPAILVCPAFSQTVESSLGWNNFIEGVSPVDNYFTVSNVPAGTFSVSFYVDKYDGLPVQIDLKGSDGWTKSFDMGSTKPGAKLTVACLSVTGDTLGSVVTRDFYILGKPSWIADTRLSNVAVVGRLVQMNAAHSIAAVVDQLVPDSITAIGRRRFSMFDGALYMNIAYNLDTRTSNITDPALGFGINIFNQKKTYRTIPVPSAALSLDTNFNLSARASDSISAMLFRLDMPRIAIPVAPAVNIRFDAGVTFWAMLKGMVVIGNQDGSWGFIKDGKDVTSLIAKVYGLGWLRGGISVLAGMLSADGILNVNGVLGGGFTYTSIPSSTIGSVFGGGLTISGEVRIDALFGLWNLKRFGPKTFYTTTFGTLPSKTIRKEHSDDVIASSTRMVNPAFVVPEYAPQPMLDARSGRVGAIWFSDSTDYRDMWLSISDAGGAAFGSPAFLMRTTHPVSSPQIALTPNGSAFIAWSESRYTNETASDSLTLVNILASQDIAVAVYDAGSRTMSPDNTIADNFIGKETGRAEAEPRICALDDSRAVVTWMVKEDDETSIWYSQVSHSGSTVTTTPPAPIAMMSGVNRQPTLARMGNNEVMVLWINETLNVDSTMTTRIIYSVFDGSDWSAPTPILTGVNAQRFKDATLAISGQYGVAAWTSSIQDTTGHIDQTIDAYVWDRQNGTWLQGSEYHRLDSIMDFQNLRLSISDGGKVTVSYQSVPRVVDSLMNDNGHRELVLRDLNDLGKPWREVAGLEFLSDSTAYVWDGQTAFTSNETLYLLTEEHGENKEPKGAVRFGDPKLGLVLRAVRLTDDLSVVDVDEPSTLATVGKELHEPAIGQFDLTPNPAVDAVLISYRVARTSLVTIEISDMLGERIATILDQHLEPGAYQTCASVDRLAPGTYVCKITSNGDVDTKLVQVVR